MREKDCIPQGYKKTSFGIIPQEWEVKKVKDLCKIDAMSLPSSTMPNYEFDYISLSDVKRDTLEIATSHQIFKTAPSRARRILKKDDVIISTVRPNLKNFFMVKSEVKDLIASTGFTVLSPYKCDSKFLLLYFFSQIIDKQFNALVVGSNYPAVNSCDVANIRIAVPPIQEQKKIAELLSEWDKAIELQTKLIEKLELRKHALMQRLLTGRVRLNGFSDQWRKVKLGELCEITTGSLNADAMKEDGIYPFFTCAKEVYKIDKYAFDTEALLISGNGEHLGYIHYYKGRFNAYQRTYILDKFIANIFFIKFVLRHSLPKRILQTKSSSNTPYIVIGTLKDMELKIPQLQEQTKIANVLIVADTEIELEKKKLSSLRNQKRGLMQQLLTGKKRVKINL